MTVLPEGFFGVPDIRKLPKKLRRLAKKRAKFISEREAQVRKAEISKFDLMRLRSRDRLGIDSALVITELESKILGPDFYTKIAEEDYALLEELKQFSKEEYLLYCQCIHSDQRVLVLSFYMRMLEILHELSNEF